MLLGLCAALFGLAGQTFLVYRSFGGQWSALFCTAADRQLAPVLEGVETYRFQGTYGYDGHFYRAIAYDPLVSYRPAPEVFDDLRLRWRRILLPASAWALSGGRAAWVDNAYRAVVLFSLFAGVAISARWAMLRGLSPGWGLVFLFLPGVVISLERMTVDIVLAALTAAFAYGVTTGDRRWTWTALLLSPLARETGLALTGAWCLVALIERRWRDVLIGGATALPWIGWASYVGANTEAGWVSFITGWPLEGLARRLVMIYPPMTSWFNTTAAVLEHISLTGVCALFGLVAYRLWKQRPPTTLGMAAAAFVAGVGLLSFGGVWTETYAFGRILTPALLLLPAAWPRPSSLLPLLLVLPRVLAQFVPHIIRF